MAGPNMEVFRFGFYLFFPIFAMYKFGDPVWFDTYVQPYKDYLLPPLEGSNKPPKTAAGLHEELSRLKAARKSRQGDGSVPGQHVDYASDQVAAQGQGQPAPSRTLEAMAVDQAVKRDQALAADVPSSGSRWGWGTATSTTAAEGTSSGRLV